MHAVGDGPAAMTRRLFQQQHLGPGPARNQRSLKAGNAAADHQDVREIVERLVLLPAGSRHGKRLRRREEAPESLAQAFGRAGGPGHPQAVFERCRRRIAIPQNAVPAGDFQKGSAAEAGGRLAAGKKG